MNLNDGQERFLKGRLGKDWIRKEVTSQGVDKVIWESSLAIDNRMLGRSKDDPTIWVSLTAWPDRRDNSDAEGQAYAAGSGKGSTVVVRGKLKEGEYNGEQKWQMSVYDVAAMLMPPRDGAQAVKQAFPGATEEKYDDPMMEPF